MDRIEKEQKLLQRVAIEQDLNAITYCGVGLGSMVSNRLNLYFFHRVNYSFSQALATIAKLWVGVFARIRINPGFLNLRKISFIYYSGQPKDIDIFKDVKQAFVKGDYSENLKTDFLRAITFKEIREWLSQFGKFYGASGKALRDLQQMGILNRNQRLVMHHLALTYGFRVSMIRSILEQQTPEVMVFTYDRDPMCALIAATAGSMKIRTAVIVHGSTFHVPIGFVPAICKDVLCWSEMQGDVFVKYGTPPQNIIISGFPKFRVLTREEAILQKERLGLPAGKKVMLFATSPLENQTDSEIDAIESFVKAFENTAGHIIPVVKLHPTRYDTLINQLTNLFPGLLILPNYYTTYESLAISDIVVSLTSTFGLESLAAGIPICIFNPTNCTEEGVGKILRIGGAARYAANSEELNLILKETETNSIEKVFNKEENLLYLNELCRYTDGESVNKIVQYINNQLK